MAKGGRGGGMSDGQREMYEKDQADAKRRSGGAGWVNIEDGKLHLFRLLPNIDPKQRFYIRVGQHYGLGPTGKSNVYCPRSWFGSKEDCPICDYVDLVMQKSKKPKELESAKEMKLGMRWMALTIDRDGDDQPKLWGFPVSAYNQIMEYIMGKYPDLLDLDEGYDINVKRTGTGMKTKYQVYPDKDRSRVSEDAWDAAFNMEDYFEARMFSAPELERVMGGEDPMDIVDERSGGGAKRDEKPAPRDREEASDRGRGRTDEPEERPDRVARDADRAEDSRGRDRGSREAERPERGRESGDARDDRGSERDRGADRSRADEGRGRERDPEPRGRESGGRDRDEAPRGDAGRERGRDDRSARDERPADDRGGRSRGGERDQYDDAAEKEIERLRDQAGARRR